MTDKKVYLNLLDRELVVAKGCTEPAAVALASSVASGYLSDRVTSLRICASGNILKNAMSVIIPGTGKCGVSFAAALGFVLRKQERGLEILNHITQENIQNAQALIDGGLVSVEQSKTDEKLYILVTARSKKTTVKVEIQKFHTNIARIEVNGKTVFQNDYTASGEDTPPDISVRSIWDFVQSVDIGELERIRQGMELNRAVAAEGLRNSYGLMVGKSLMSDMEEGYASDSLACYSMAVTSAASDARMGGCTMSVMSNSGSGNQGIEATLPVVAAAEKLGNSEEELIRALTLSNLIAIYIKSKFGRLSALCGATVAATGASGGIAYLMGGKFGNITAAIQNMLGNISGMLCDGAKAGCALKLSTCTNAAVQSARLAMRNVVIRSTDGIIENDVEKTIGNFCSLANEGSHHMDQMILGIMVRKANGASS